MRFSTDNDNPTHGITIRGEVTDRKDLNKQRREIGIEKAESRKLPLKDYPLTNRNIPGGLEVLALSGRGQCQASFHRFPEGSRFGEGAYIGSATRRLKDRSQAEKFSAFLEQAGVLTPGTPVSLDFHKSGTVMKVYLSGAGPDTNKSSQRLVTP